MKLCHYSFCTFLALMGMCTTQDGESTTTRSSSVDQAARMVDVNDTLQKAADLLHNRQLTGARTLCTLTLSVAPQNARAHFLLGAIEQKAGRTQEAATHTLTAARLRPDKPLLLMAAGSLLCRAKDFGKALDVFEEAIEANPSVPRYHMGAAIALRKLGRREEATAKFRRAAELGPRDAHIQYKLAQHLRSTGCLEPAVEAYARALQLDPGHELAAFWLAATKKLADEAAVVRGEPRDEPSEGAELPPAEAPRDYVIALYDSYAETFDAHLEGALEYRTPTIVMGTVASLLPRRRFRRCLDLGCGTGLSGQAALALCDRLVGVDLSAAMLHRARQKGLYHRLIAGDVTDTIISIAGKSLSSGVGWDVPENENERGKFIPVRQEGSGKDGAGVAGGGEDAGVKAGDGQGDGDLVISCDVFGYMGDLRPCFKAVRALLLAGDTERDDGDERAHRPIFAFSAEAPARSTSTGDGSSSGDDGGLSLQQPGYQLQGTGRYSHSREYLHDICSESGFDVLAANYVVMRKNAGLPVHGYVFVVEFLI